MSLSPGAWDFSPVAFSPGAWDKKVLDEKL